MQAPSHQGVSKPLQDLHGTFRHLPFHGEFSNFITRCSGLETCPIIFLCHQCAPHPGTSVVFSGWHFHGGTPGAAVSPGAHWSKRRHFGHLLALDSEQFPSPYLKSKTSWISLSWVTVLLPLDPPCQTSPFLLLEVLWSHQSCKSTAT